MSKHNKVKEYAVYRNDEFLFIGNVKFIAEQFNKSEMTIYNTIRNSKNEDKNKGLFIIELREDEDDE